MIQTTLRSVLAGMLLATVVAGCGTSPATPSPCSCPEPQPMPIEPGPGGPIGQPPAGGQDQQARELVGRSQATFMGMKGYELVMKYFQKQGSKTASGTYEIRGKNPRGMRIYIKDGNSAGVTVSWQGGSSARVKPAGLLGAITVNLSLTDTKLKGVRGYTLDQTDLPSMYGYMMDPANQMTFLGNGPNGVAVAISGPGLLQGCQRMITSFDPNTLMPRSVEFSDGREVVFRMTISSMKPKSNVSLEI